MADQDLNIITPSIAKSSSIAMAGQGFGAVGPTGEASFQLPLPISPGRGTDPQLALTYSSQSGNGPFGLGWNLNNGQIRRRTNKGVPLYGDDDEIIGHDLQICTKERNADGTIKSRIENSFNGKDIGPHTVVRFTPEVESDFSIRERWEPVIAPPGEPKAIFWLVSGPDGSLHMYGKTEDSRVADPDDPLRVGIWLLCESMTPHGEHICYVYKADDQDPDPVHDYSAQCYLHQVLYGNFTASQDLYSWTVDHLTDLDWHFHLLFDYGERPVSLTEKPEYDGPSLRPWLTRPDPFSAFGHGFEVGTRRRCEQVLMFHHFPAELGTSRVLVRRLLLKYNEHETQWSYSRITSAHYQAWDASGAMENMPPTQFEHSPFSLNTTPKRLFEDDNMPGIEDGGLYKCVDLYGEGLPGVLCQYDQCWYYREPERGTPGTDEIRYAPWKVLENIPVADRNKPVLQILTDLIGIGRFQWICAQPGFSGFRALNADRTWAEFQTFAGIPPELFSPHSQLGDLAGEGLLSLAVIGPRAVRFYRNNLEGGFQPPQDVPHQPADDRLPVFGDHRSELVFMGDLLGSDTSGLCRIRHDEIKCWPNLGHGKLGKGRVLPGPTFRYGEFDAARVRIADVDGSGAPALIYLNTKTFDIYLNRGGKGLEETPISVPWPMGEQYDRLCDVTLIDRQGLGCASLIFTKPHMKPRHWCYDLQSAKPYLITSSNNNLGCSASVVYRSSAQQWLDEKLERLTEKPDEAPACHLPLTVQVVSRQTQLDEVTGNCLSQSFKYRKGYYDPWAREYRGFGYVEQTDSESATGAEDVSFTAPVRTCSWFIIGQFMDPPRDDYFDRDLDAVPLGNTLISQYDPVEERDVPFTPPDDSALPYEIARGMSGTLMRTEIYNGEDDPKTALPYSVEEYRYLVREVRAKGQHYPDAIILPLLAETISYRYEQFINDPLCGHEINLRWSQYGLPTRSLTVSYARRLTESAPPPSTDPDEQQWWRDAHDEAQQSYYVSETRARFIDLDANPQRRRLGLPWQQRSDALILPKAPLPDGLEPSLVSFEQLTLRQDSAQWKALRVLTGQSVQRYLKTSDRSLLPDDDAEYEALAGPLEVAQLDKTALDAYSDLPPPFDIRAELTNIGYTPMDPLFEPRPPEDEDKNLWSSRHGFAQYETLAKFFKVVKYHETPSHGVTKAEYDGYQLAIKSVELPDGCTTRIEYDYHSLQVVRSIDANENTQEAIYQPFGQLLAHSFFGTENGIATGFQPLSDFLRPEDPRPDPAIDDPVVAVQRAASTLRKDLFSWMGVLPRSVSPELLAKWIANGDVLPSGHVCASARQRLRRGAPMTASDQALGELIATVRQVPVHSVSFEADSYPDDQVAAQIRIVKACVDGFGRPLQTQQLVDPGMAYAVDADGKLIIEDGQYLEVFADPRWRISERVEYNNKGLPVRQFRPFFANTHGYVDDRSLREFGYFDQLFYDPLGRVIKLINAKGYFSRETHHPWYRISEDFNDTAEPPPTKPARRLR